MQGDELSPALRPGARIEMEIPTGHPYFRWLHDYQHETMDNGGLMRHGVMTLKLGGIEQRYDLVDVDWAGHKSDMRLKATWRMYGDPQDTNYD